MLSNIKVLATLLLLGLTLPLFSQVTDETPVTPPAAQELKDTTPNPAPKPVVIQAVPVTVLYRIETTKGKFKDINTAVFPSMAVHQRDPQKQAEILLKELHYSLYQNNRLPNKNLRIRILDVKRF